MSVHRNLVLEDAVTEKFTIDAAGFFDILEKHDWYSSFSDDNSVVKAGENALSRLTEIAAKHHVFEELLESYREHKFSGEGWSKSEVPKPVVGENPSVEIEKPVESEHGILISTCSEEDCHGNDVWDNTINVEGNFLVKEIAGNRRNVGVFPDRDTAKGVATYAVSFPDGGFDSVVIENIGVYQSFDEWL